MVNPSSQIDLYLCQQILVDWRSSKFCGSRKKTLHAAEKETERVQSLRVEFWLKLHGISAENLIFIDEAGANISLIRHSARSREGKRAHGLRPQKRCQNVSIIGAIAQGRSD